MSSSETKKHERKNYIIGENHTLKMMTFCKIQQIKRLNSEKQYLFFGEHGMKDEYKIYDKEIEIIQARKIISDISLIIYAYMVLISSDEEDKINYIILINKIKIFLTTKEYNFLLKYDNKNKLLDNKKKILIDKIFEYYKKENIPIPIIQKIYNYLKKDKTREALDEAEKIVNFSIYRKILDHNTVDINIPFIIIVGNNHIAHIKTLFRNAVVNII